MKQMSLLEKDRVRRSLLSRALLKRHVPEVGLQSEKSSNHQAEENPSVIANRDLRFNLSCRCLSSCSYADMTDLIDPCGSISAITRKT